MAMICKVCSNGKRLEAGKSLRWWKQQKEGEGSKNEHPVAAPKQAPAWSPHQGEAAEFT